MGRTAEQDVADEPTVTLREAMALAADRDLVARQYAGGYREVLHEALPALGTALGGWDSRWKRPSSPRIWSCCPATPTR